jgi:hypothetical protein
VAIADPIAHWHREAVSAGGEFNVHALETGHVVQLLQERWWCRFIFTVAENLP